MLSLLNHMHNITTATVFKEEDQINWTNKTLTIGNKKKLLSFHFLSNMVRLGILSLKDIYPGTWFIARFLLNNGTVWQNKRGYKWNSNLIKESGVCQTLVICKLNIIEQAKIPQMWNVHS